jgi:hypothetical protein
VNAWHQKFFIPLLKLHDRVITHQQDKVDALWTFYSGQFGPPPPHESMIDWNTMAPMRHDLGDLDRDLTEEEVKQAVMQTPNEKVPGVDGSIDAFYKTCWNTITTNVMAALREMSQLRVGWWNLLNTANVAPIAKKRDTQVMGDYRPISIMHSMAKLLGKILTTRLAPHLDQIVSRSQSAFIKGHTIHDNFQYIQGAIKHFHHSKTPMLFLKLDIAKAFDNISWE